MAGVAVSNGLEDGHEAQRGMGIVRPENKEHQRSTGLQHSLIQREAVGETQ